MMNDNSLSVLKTFTRKLANCRYRVSLDNVIKYMQEGRFGYSIDENYEDVITNDFVFADDIASLIAHIKAIFREPHLFLKKEELVRNASVASKMDADCIKMNYRDDKLWRVRPDGETALEYAHTFVNEDDLAIYENRFICALIDLILDAVAKKLNDLCTAFDTLNRQILGTNYKHGLKAITYTDYADTKDGLPVLLSVHQPIVNVIGSLMRSKKTLFALKGRELYKACEKAGRFDMHSLKTTNIFQHDKDYNYCYVFYLNYLNKDPIITTEKKMYQGFMEVNFFTALDKLGYKPDEENQDIMVSQSAELKFDNLVFTKDPFTFDVSVKSDTELFVKITAIPDGNVSNVIIKTLSTAEIQKLKNFTSVDDYARNKNENLPYGITRYYVVSDYEETTDDYAIQIIPNKSNTLQKIMGLIKSCTLIAEGASAVHGRYCPVCGSNLLAPEGEDIICSVCETQYHIFNYSAKEIIWFKRLPKIDEENKGINIGEQVDSAITEDNVRTRTSIKKSFTAKMHQTSEENKEFYNELKNYVLEYKKVSSRVSFAHDTFSSSRLPKVRFAIKGKTLVAFFALDPKLYDDRKYFGHDYGDIKKYEETPLMVKVKSERGVKRAKELIDTVFDGFKKKQEFVPVKYKFPYRSDKQLLKEGLAKTITVKIRF
ncbi:MAG: hypothetical protein IJR66_00330 [Clostridia bacterium]|nr:hypothetical protein [Clostridia bacterium]